MPKWEMVDDRPKIVEGADDGVQTIPVYCLRSLIPYRAPSPASDFPRAI